MSLMPRHCTLLHCHSLPIGRDIVRLATNTFTLVSGPRYIWVNSVYLALLPLKLNFLHTLSESLGPEQVCVCQILQFMISARLCVYTHVHVCLCMYACVCVIICCYILHNLGARRRFPKLVDICVILMI